MVKYLGILGCLLEGLIILTIFFVYLISHMFSPPFLLFLRLCTPT